MELKLNGVTRIVFLVGGYAIKIPNFTYSHQHFLQGCYANYSERKYCERFSPKKIIDCKLLEITYNRVIPTVWCSLFGLISIQRRGVLLERRLTHEEIEYFKNQTTDINKDNFAYYNGRLVCIDYV